MTSSTVTQEPTQPQALSIHQDLALRAKAGQRLAAEALELLDTCDEMYAQLQDQSVIGWERGYLSAALDYGQHRIEVMIRELSGLEAA